MSTSRAWNLLRVSSGGLWWGLYPRVAGGARHGCCQGREWRPRQAWGNPPGQLWHGETSRDWEDIFSIPLWFFPTKIMWHLTYGSITVLWWMQNGSPLFCIVFMLHGLTGGAVSLTWYHSSAEAWLLSLFCLPVFGETASDATGGWFTSALTFLSMPIREWHVCTSWCFCFCLHRAVTPAQELLECPDRLDLQDSKGNRYVYWTYIPSGTVGGSVASQQEGLATLLQEKSVEDELIKFPIAVQPFLSYFYCRVPLGREAMLEYQEILWVFAGKLLKSYLKIDSVFPFFFM